MATIYVDDTATGAANGTSWADAYTTVAAARAAGFSAGDTCLIAYTHTEGHSGSTLNLDGPANCQSNPVKYISADPADSSYRAGATINITSNNSMDFANTSDDIGIWCRGITFSMTNSGGGASLNFSTRNGGTAYLYFLDCIFNCFSENNNPRYTFGPSFSGSVRQKRIILRNCTINLRNASGTGGDLSMGTADVEIRGCTFGLTSSGCPGSIFTAQQQAGVFDLLVIDTDLSGVTGTHYLIDAQYLEGGSMTFRNVRHHSGMSGIYRNSIPSPRTEITLINVDGGDTHHVFSYYRLQGTLTVETAIYANDAVEFDGTPYSWKIVTSADCSEANPFPCPIFEAWNDGTVEIDVSVEFLHDSATALTDRQIWLEVSYAASASYPTGATASDRNASPCLGSAANQATGAATWTESLANDNEQKCEVTFTPAEKGLLEGTLFIGKASYTLYVDPRLRVA